MAKVMVSLPDEVLRDLDRQAESKGMTRSGLIRQWTEEESRARSRRRAEEMRRIDEEAGPAVEHGGNVAELVKANRPRWPKS